jgi:hypothetical protein
MHSQCLLAWREELEMGGELDVDDENEDGQMCPTACDCCCAMQALNGIVEKTDQKYVAGAVEEVVVERATDRDGWEVEAKKLSELGVTGLGRGLGGGLSRGLSRVGTGLMELGNVKRTGRKSLVDIQRDET